MSSELQQRFIPPKWDDDSAYVGAHGWSYRRWAWEFLRRNVEYQAACDAASRLRGADHSAEGAKFGRVDLRPFWKSYDNIDDAHPRWLAESVEMARIGNEWSDDNPMKPLRVGHVAIVFDLTQTAVAGTAAFASMKKRADELLRQALADFAKSNKNTDGKPRQFKPAAKPLLERYLRLYDALEIFRVPRDATISVLYPQYWDNRNQAISDGVRAEAHKLISKNLKKARQIVRGEYQRLVPLDVARVDEEKEEAEE